MQDVQQQPVKASDERAFPASWRRLAVESLAVAVIAWIGVASIYRVWDAPLRVSWFPYSDGLTVFAFAKALGAGGWIYTNPYLGAPFEQQMYDFPYGGETLQYAAFAILGLFTDSPGLIVNFYYLFSFGMLAVIAFLVMRHLRFTTLSSALLAWTYSFAAFHFARGEGHLQLGTAYSVPLACLLLIWASRWRIRFLKDPGPGAGPSWRANIRWRRVLAALGICVFIGGWHSYYTIFTIVLLASAAALNAVRWRDWRTLVVGALGVATLGSVLLAFLSPSLLYWQQHGNINVAKRYVSEQEMYGLEVSRLLLPSDGSRIESLATLRSLAMSGSPIYGEFGQSLGLLGAAGLLGLLYVALVGFARRRESTDESPVESYDRGALRQSVSTSALLAILFSTVGGLGIIAALGGLTQIRAWNRISPFILFFALIQVAIWGEQFSLWARARAHWRYVGALLGAVAVLGTAVSAYAGPPTYHPYPSLIASWDNDRAFLKDIDARMPTGSMIMQYPVMPYPENGPVKKMGDYDPLRAYIADEGDLKWSYGAMKGRPESDWQTVLSDPKRQVSELPALLGLGFTGLWIDTFGYVGDEATLEQLRAELGPDAPLISRDGRLLFYDLRPYKNRLGKTDAELRRRAELQLLTIASVASGSRGVGRNASGTYWWVETTTATIRIARNAAALKTQGFNSATASLSLGLAGAPCSTPQTVTITTPSGTKITTKVHNDTVAETVVPVTLANDGDTEITLRTDGSACPLEGYPAPVLFSVWNLRILEPDAVSVAGR